MAKINPEAYKQKSDQLNPEDIEDAAILTVKEFVDGDRTDREGKWALLKFDETGDKVIFLTDAGLDAMVQRYGDDTDDWTGKPVPVETHSTRNGDRVRIMPAEAWDDAFKEAKVKAPPASQSRTTRAAAAPARVSNPPRGSRR